MSLKGSLESFSLGEIFQSLSINQHTGTLKVHDGEIQKLIYFTNGSIIHLSTGKRDDFRLGDMLAWSRLLTDEQLAEAQRESDTAGRRLGEILVERGWATEDDISQMVVKNIEEEIYDLFLWKKADFEFLVGHFPEEFLDEDQKASKVQLSTNSLIMEALRRIDEWTVIRDRISTLKAVFAPSNGGVAPDAMEDIELPEIVKGEARLVDGHRNVAEIVSSSPASKFEVCKLLYELLLRNLIRPLEVKELVALAEDHFSDGQFTEARKYLEFAVEQDGKNPDLRLQLADAYTHTAADKAAVDHLLTAARLHQETEEYEMTVVAYRKALELQPRNPDIMESLFNALVQADKLVQAQALGLELGELLRETLQFSKAAVVYQKLAEKDPKETTVRMLLAGAYKGKGDLEAALVEYHKVADQLEKEMRFTELEKVYRILKALATRDEDLIRIRHKYERIEQRRESRERRRKLISYGAVAAVFLALLGGGWEVYARYEYARVITWPEVYNLSVNSGMSMDRIYKTVESDRADFEKYPDYVRRYQEWVGPDGEMSVAIEALKEFRRSHMLSLQSFTAKEAQAKIEDLQREVQDHVLMLEREHREHTMKRLEQRAEEILAKADALLENGDVGAAWKEYYSLSDDMFRLTKVQAELTLPVLVTSDPPGAQAFLDGALAGTATREGAVVRLDSSGETFGVRFELPGYEAATQKDLRVDKFQTVSMRLRRETLGRRDLDGAVHNVPTPFGAQLVFCTRGGEEQQGRAARLYRIVGKFQSGTPLKLAPPGGRITAPLIHSGSLFAGTDEGQLWQLTQDKRTPKQLARVESDETAVRIPITAGPTALPEFKEIYYGTYDGRVFRLDPTDPKARPKLIFRAENKVTSIQALQPSPGAREEVWILIGSLDEQVRVIGGETGRLVWSYPVEGDVLAAPVILGDWVLVGTHRGAFFVLKRSDGSLLKSLHLSTDPILSVAAEGDTVYLGIGGRGPRLIALRVPGCEEVWHWDHLKGAPDTGIRLYDEALLVGDRSGRLTVLEARDGKLRWDFQSEAAITALPLCVRDKVYVGDQDGTVTILSLKIEEGSSK